MINKNKSKPKNTQVICVPIFYPEACDLNFIREIAARDKYTCRGYCLKYDKLKNLYWRFI